MNWFIPLISAVLIAVWHADARAIVTYRLSEPADLTLVQEFSYKWINEATHSYDGAISGGKLFVESARTDTYAPVYGGTSTTASELQIPLPVKLNMVITDPRIGTFSRAADWGGPSVVLSSTGWTGPSTYYYYASKLPHVSCALYPPKEFISQIDYGDRLSVEPGLFFEYNGGGLYQALSTAKCTGRLTYVRGSVTLDLEFKPKRIDMNCRVGQDCTGTFNAVTRSDYQQFTHKVTFKMDPELSLYDFTSGSWHKDSFEFTATGINDRKFGFRVPDAGPGVRVYTIRGTAEYE
ncbi:hypothetical protein A4O94_22740 [Salmonella enterica subsp. enterica serovar Chester]|nr:hypothetical protein [Salmonella enterica subsp. enterica serovar Chester]